MSSVDFNEIKAFVFDCYGTLVDWESGICNGLKPLTTGRKWSKEDTLLAFGSVETDVQARNPTMLYSDVLAAVYDELARRLKGEPSAPSTAGTAATRVEAAGSEASSSATVAGTSAAAAEQTDNAASTLFSDEARAFSTSIADSPVFPDTVSGLAKLSSLGYKLVVLSNSDRPTFEHTRAKLEQGFKFDAILLAEDIGSYKPDPRNFKYAIKHLSNFTPSIAADEILVVAQSLCHDHVPAHALGLLSVWIDRQDAITCKSGDGVPESEEGKRGLYTLRFETLGEFADDLEQKRA